MSTADASVPSAGRHLHLSIQIHSSTGAISNDAICGTFLIDYYYLYRPCICIVLVQKKCTL